MLWGNCIFFSLSYLKVTTWLRVGMVPYFPEKWIGRGGHQGHTYRSFKDRMDVSCRLVRMLSRCVSLKLLCNGGS
jgi:hypothetical protein